MRNFVATKQQQQWNHSKKRQPRVSYGADSIAVCSKSSDWFSASCWAACLPHPTTA